MHSIDIDFDVYKALMQRRKTEDVSFNDVLRELLGLSPASASSARKTVERTDRPWITRGVKFSHGTEFRGHHNGVDHKGQADNGALVVDGERFDTPSEAAFFITGDDVDGWYFWECRLPGTDDWVGIHNLRKT